MVPIRRLVRIHGDGCSPATGQSRQCWRVLGKSARTRSLPRSRSVRQGYVPSPFPQRTEPRWLPCRSTLSYWVRAWMFHSTPKLSA